jgi:anthranilate synthase/aminodeoxychorismate synthase-like glutamine amidotransferase
MIVIIDNYDSFTYNLVQMIGARLKTSQPHQNPDEQIRVLRNDAATVDEVLALRPTHVVISPGPGRPEEAGISIELTSACIQNGIPLLGVCLGHQGLACSCGSKVVRAESLVHGKSCKVYHDNSSLFQGLSNPFEAARYHSLIVDEESLSKDLIVSAWTSEGEIMGLRHTGHKVCGVQFHPESWMTLEGKRLIQNFLDF